MTIFLLNILLALIWAALTEVFAPGNLAIGYVVGFLLLWFFQPITGRSSYFRKVGQVIRFFFYFLKEMAVANVRVAWNVLSPISSLKPEIVAVPLEAKTDLEITLLANLITLTPGSYSLDVSDDRKVLYVHALDVDNPDEMRRQIKEGFERRLLEVLR